MIIISPVPLSSETPRALAMASIFSTAFNEALVPASVFAAVYPNNVCNSPTLALIISVPCFTSANSVSKAPTLEVTILTYSPLSFSSTLSE